MSRTGFGVALLFAALGATAGCKQPPASAAWKDGEKVVAPESTEARGQLVVETAETGTALNGETPRAPYYVYDERGRLLARFPHESGVPVDLPVGRYVVVSPVSGEHRRVQVEIAKSRTTMVTLKEFKTAPAAE